MATDFTWTWPRPSGMRPPEEQQAINAFAEQLDPRLRLDPHGAVAQAFATWMHDRSTDAETIAHALDARDPTALRTAAAALGPPAHTEAAAATLGARARLGPLAIVHAPGVDGTCACAILSCALGHTHPSMSIEALTTPHDRDAIVCAETIASHAMTVDAPTIVVLGLAPAHATDLDALTARGHCVVFVDHHHAAPDAVPLRGLLVHPCIDRQEAAHGLCTSQLAWWIARELLDRTRRPPSETARLRRHITALAAIAASCTHTAVSPLTRTGRFTRALVWSGLRCLTAPYNGLAQLARMVNVVHPESDPDRMRHAFRHLLDSALDDPADCPASELLRLDASQSTIPAATERTARLHRHAQRTHDALARVNPATIDAGVVWDTETPHRYCTTLAQHVVEATSRPILWIARDDTHWRGSARSAGPIDWRSILAEAAARELLTTAEGPPDAPEITLQSDQKETFNTYLERALDHTATAAALAIEVHLGPGLLAPQTLSWLAWAFDACRPFGPGWPAPSCALHAVSIDPPRLHRDPRGALRMTATARASGHAVILHWCTPLPQLNAAITDAGPAPHDLSGIPTRVCEGFEGQTVFEVARIRPARDASAPTVT